MYAAPLFKEYIGLNIIEYPVLHKLFWKDLQDPDPPLQEH